MLEMLYHMLISCVSFKKEGKTIERLMLDPMCGLEEDFDVIIPSPPNSTPI